MYELWSRLSYYKTTNKILEAEVYEYGICYYVDYQKWNNLFEPNICNSFLNFIMNNRLFMENFCVENEKGMIILKNEELEKFIQDINFIL